MALTNAAHSWSTSHLVEYLAALSEAGDHHAAQRAAVEQVVESLDAEVGGLYHGTTPVAVVGLPPDDPHLLPLVRTAREGRTCLEIPGLGRCRVAGAPLNLAADSPCLVVARAGEEEFAPDELLLLRGMVWVLDLALRPLQVLGLLHEQQRMLELVARVQRAIAARAPLPEVFDVVTQSCLELLDVDVAALNLAEGDHLLAASVSTAVDGADHLARQARINGGIGYDAFRSGQLMRTGDYPGEPYARPEVVELGARAAMAAPVRENGFVVGSLAVVSRRPGFEFSEAQEQTLRTFADQVSVALSDARSLRTAQEAIIDPVTGLPNRAFFLDRLERAVARGGRVDVLFLDLDRFKIVNDTMGHAAGDDLLRQIGQRLRTCVAQQDWLARFGGDEFAVLMEDADDERVSRIGRHLLSAAEQPYLVGAEEVTVGGSIGAAGTRQTREPAEILRNADTAMYKAKRAGGNMLVVFDQRMRTELVRRRTLESDLRRAVAGDALDIVFQPVVCLRDRRLAFAEALVRWQHPIRGLLRPSEFVPLAEETGLVVPLGRRVLAAACQHAVEWPARDDGYLLPVSVNLSALQLLDRSFVPDLREILGDAGLDPSRLIVEITETVLVTDVNTVVTRLRAVRDLGVRVAVDDFGTGYSSLASLRMLPVDVLKVDRSFVRGAASGWEGAEFIRTIVRLAEALSMIAVAEGVETQEQAEVLVRSRCSLGQGFLFGHPMAPVDFAGLVAAGRRPAPLAAVPGARHPREADLR